MLPPAIALVRSTADLMKTKLPPQKMATLNSRMSAMIAIRRELCVIVAGAAIAAILADARGRREWEQGGAAQGASDALPQCPAQPTPVVRRSRRRAARSRCRRAARRRAHANAVPPVSYTHLR